MTARKRILLVDDEEIILADLGRTLRKQGYEIAGTALSGPEAIQAAAELKPDLVLMDVRLQGSMDGIEAARQIWRASGVPVVFVTAHVGALALRTAELPGPYSSIGKPYSPAELCRTIESFLPARQARRKIVK